MRRFKLVRVMMGSGWPSGHVAIDWYHRFPGKAGGNELCLTGDTQDADELLSEVDALIAELEALRAEIPQKFAQWTEEYEKGKARRRPKT